MPWTADQFRSRHNKGLSDAQAAKAASMANAMLKGGTPEGIAIATANKHVAHMAGGGDALGDPAVPETPHFGGLIHATTPGRTDRVPLAVPADSHVIPADVVSSLGQGNSAAGAKILEAMLKTGPYGSAMPGKGSPSTQKRGGDVGKSSILAAGGEFIVPRATVLRIGGGSIDKGQKILRELTKRIRAHQMQFLKKAPEPKK